MSRMEWMKARFGASLKNRLESEGLTFSEAAGVEHFASYDPTKNNRFTQWLISTYMKDGYRFEDLSRARSTLEHFVAFNQRLSEDQRDINQYRRLSDVWKAVKPFVEQPETDESLSGKAKKRSERAKAYADSLILAETDDWTVAVPLTVEAAKWWGKGTQWCTAADNDNMFEVYHETGPLIVMVMNDGKKVQFFVNDNDFQFMDENDEPVLEEWILDHEAALTPIFLWCIDRNKQVFNSIPQSMATHDMIMKYLSMKNASLEYVNPKSITKDMVDLVVSTSGRDLKYIPNQFRTDDMYLKAIETNPYAIVEIPRHLVVRDLVLKAVSKNGVILKALLMRFPEFEKVKS